MEKRKIISVSIIGLLITILVAQSLSQTLTGYRPRSRPGSYRPPRSSSASTSSSVKTEETEQTQEQSVKGAVGATDEQWKLIKPKLELVKKLQQQACVLINTAGGASGGSSSQGGSGYAPGAVGGSGSSGSGSFGASGGGAVLKGQAGGSSTITNEDGTRIWMMWKWQKPWAEKGPQRNDEKVCDELFDLLQSKNADPNNITRKVLALRASRQETKKELAEAQRQLRKVLTVEQEARLVALGWLD